MTKTSLKPPIENTVEITGFSHEGRGITRINDKTTFIANALPEEIVTCRLTKRHSRYNEAEVIEILKASKERTTPNCQHFDICGGCSLQHMTLSAQLQFKQQVLLEQLKHFGEVIPQQLLPPLSGHPWHYRRKARLGVRYVNKKERLLVGFREKSSRYLADIRSCPVLDKRVGLNLEAINQLIASLTQYEHIAQIEVAASDNAIALVFRHLTDLPNEDIEKLLIFGKQYQFEIYLQPNKPNPMTKLWPSDQPERLSYSLPAYHLELQFHPLDFTQINGEINPLMIAQALQLLSPNETDEVLDLFCGLGNFTLPLARFAKKVVGIEGSLEMVDRAKTNATLNQISNTAFYADNLTAPNSALSYLQQSYDKILLDPPRTGALEIIQHFPRLKANKILYVSCNPATLARDAKVLVHEQKYHLKTAGIINMFPHTSHIEAMALFEK